MSHLVKNDWYEVGIEWKLVNEIEGGRAGCKQNKRNWVGIESLLIKIVQWKRKNLFCNLFLKLSRNKKSISKNLPKNENSKL